jgi:hypothetical protein
LILRLVSARDLADPMEGVAGSISATISGRSISALRAGALFEVATNEPGFDTDEDTAHLGQALKLPRQHSHLREKLEQALEPIVD